MFSVTRLKWLMNRLRSMEHKEVASRLFDIGRHGVVYATRWRLPRRARRRASAHGQPIAMPHADWHAWHICPEVQLDYMAQADRWLQQRIQVFGLKDIPFGQAIDWHRDYSSGIRGPQKYSSMIDHRDAAVVGDIKYIWELNRLHHLVSLALAYVWTDKAAYWDTIEQHCRSWIAQNPFMVGLNWKSPLEAGIRLISWALVAWLTADDAKSQDFFRQDMRETLYAHQYFIRTFYAKHSSANNHLIGEMAGLYIGAVCWPWFRESAAWQVFAREQLIRAIAEQVGEDGVGKELATEYQLFILEFFLLSGALGHAIGDSFPASYWQRMQKMATFLEAVSDREGNLPLFGDGDSGQVISEYVPVQQRTRSLLAILHPTAAHAPHAEHRGVQGLADLRTRLLLWGKMPQAFPIQPLPQPLPWAYPQGGYYVLSTNRGREHEMVVVVDAGEFGLPPLYAHGHADALSFWLSYRGRAFLVDSGTFSYYADEAWRSYFRSTAAHNTVRVDGEDQSVAGGRFLWREVAHCQAQYHESQATYREVEGRHAGYRRLADPVVHRRTVRMNQRTSQVDIMDRLECCDTHEIELFFHFHDQCEVRQIDATHFEARRGEACIAIHLASSLTCQLYRGSEAPIAGWMSDRFGVKTPAFTLRAHSPIAGTTELTTTIVAL
ncbi:MAG: hypothetical protein ETSY1_24715 [Candidatus Entotheonella factor]|uniref:Uncharacterized protein n=2 Tax=Candidatus Entotheonella TaxID=93171 RepID=W4LGS9_ENTF1|nr:MAG: hypothetical protein ETSY1_24715 [Candidatus Entotheonella factor]